MTKRNPVDLTNMVMVYRDDGSFLVQLRKKNDWPGINFPGGHIEDNETAEESAYREIYEETGLILDDVEPCGYFEWNVPDSNLRYISLLFRTKHFHGEIKSSEEGEVFWLKEEDLAQYPLSLDFDKVLLVMRKGIKVD